MEHSVTEKPTLVLGASEKADRYSNIAVRRLQQAGHPVQAVGRKKGTIGNMAILEEVNMAAPVHTVTLYLNPEAQKEYYDTILALQPQRVIFNPGTENDELAAMLAEKGIAPVEACTLVLLSTRGY